MTDECRLVFRDTLWKRAGRLGFFGWVTVLFSARSRSAGLAGDLRRDFGSDKMRVYALAVDDAAQTLSAEERKHLRVTAEVPDWFLDDVDRRYQRIRKQR